jgi:hypothetical protein
MSIAFASIPAAARFAWNKPVVGLVPGGKPVSIRTSLGPVLTTTGLKGIVTWPFGM